MIHLLRVKTHQIIWTKDTPWFFEIVSNICFSKLNKAGSCWWETTEWFFCRSCSDSLVLSTTGQMQECNKMRGNEDLHSDWQKPWCHSDKCTSEVDLWKQELMKWTPECKITVWESWIGGKIMIRYFWKQWKFFGRKRAIGIF